MLRSPVCAPQTEFVTDSLASSVGDMTEIEPIPGWKGRVEHGQRMTLAAYRITDGAPDVHEHQHPQEEAHPHADLVEARARVCREHPFYARTVSAFGATENSISSIVPM